MTSNSAPGRILYWGLVFAAIAAAVTYLWIAWCEFPFHAWNDIRLAPAFAVRYGINPYPLIDEGPLFTWIYGPVGILINLPATFATTPVSALRIAGVMNAIVVLAPLGLLFFSSPEVRARGQSACWLTFAVALLFVPRPNLVLQVADHCAIAAGLLANWCLARRSSPSLALIALAAAATAVSVWSKQIAVFLPLAQISYLFFHRERKAALRYVGFLSLFSFIALILFVAAFGARNLWVNLIEIPGRLPWANISDRLALRPWMLLFQVGVPAIGLIACWKGHKWPSADLESGRFFRLGALSFVTMLPIGLLGFFKAGGDINLLHGWDYIMPAALLVWFARASSSLFRTAAVLLMGVTVHTGDFMHLPRKPFIQHFAMAKEIAAAHPGHIWFPQNPVVGFYLEHTLWHTEDGVSTRFLAGYGVRERAFKTWLPSPLMGIVYPIANNAPFAVNLFPEFDHQYQYPYWMVHAGADWETATRPVVSESQLSR